MSTREPELIEVHEPEGWVTFMCSYPGCSWERSANGDETGARREGREHVRMHVQVRGTQRAAFTTVGGAMGNDAFAAVANLASVARVMFANEGIALKAVEEFRLTVKRNHDSAYTNNGPLIPAWDTFAEVTYPETPE